jgi:hypothetical protein
MYFFNRAVIVFSMLTLSCVALLNGCGGSGAAGLGNTVYITASPKTGTSLAAFKTYSSSKPFSSTSTFTDVTPSTSTTTASYTLQSNVYTGMTGSYVNITGPTLSYTQDISAAGYQTKSVPIAAFPYGITSGLSAGGTVDVENVPVVMANIDAVKANFFTSDSAILPIKFKYDVAASFTGSEATGGSISTAPVHTYFEVWIK